MSARDLWSAVVLQAVVDIDTEHYRSVEYAQAVSFFMSAGDWADSRQRIADCLELHTDDLTRLGRQAIAARHLRDGPPPVIEVVAPAVKPARPEPIPQPTQAPVVTKPRQPKRTKVAPIRAKRPPMPVRDREFFVAQWLAKQRAA